MSICDNYIYSGVTRGDLHASHRALRANYIINSTPPAIAALEGRHRKARKFTSEYFKVQQQPTSHSLMNNEHLIKENLIT